jgi:hypothetical protein
LAGINRAPLAWVFLRARGVEAVEARLLRLSKPVSKGSKEASFDRKGRASRLGLS